MVDKNSTHSLNDSYASLAACLRRTNLQARAFKAATSRRSLANSKHDLTFGAGTDGFRSSEPPITSDEVAMPDACRAGRGAKC